MSLTELQAKGEVRAGESRCAAVKPRFHSPFLLRPSPSRWLRLALGLALLAALLSAGRLDLTVLAGLRPGPGLYLLVLGTGLALAATALRWVCLVRATEEEAPGKGSGGRARESLGALVRFGLGSTLLGTISPGAVGTDAARAWHLSRTLGLPGAVGLGFLDRLMGLQMLLLLAAVAAWLTPAGPTIPVGLRAPISLGAAVASLLLAACFTGRLPRVLPRGVRPEGVHVRNARWLAAAFAFSAASAGLNSALPLLGLSALGSSGSGGFFAGTLVVLLNSVAPTPGGLGAGEAAASELLARLGPGGPAMLLARIVILLWTLGFGLLWIHSAPPGSPGEPGAGHRAPGSETAQSGPHR